MMTLRGGLGVGGREASERGNICILIADSRWRTAETNTTLKNNYPTIKKKQRKIPLGSIIQTTKQRTAPFGI